MIPLEPGNSYHIYNHANGHENLFIEEDNYYFFLKQFTKHIHPIVNTFAYCLLPNHFHFLIEVKREEELIKHPTFPKFLTLEKFMMEKFISKQFANFFSSYTQAFNKKFNRRGSMFEKNFKRKFIESDEQWQETFLYINLNPVKHKFTDTSEEWKWCSWHAYLDWNTLSLISRKEACVHFDTLENIKYCMNTKREYLLARDFE